MRLDDPKVFLAASRLVSKLSLAFFFGLASVSVKSEASQHEPLPEKEMVRLQSEKTFIVFDWDDNIFKLPSRNALFIKGEFSKSKKPRVFLISSTEFSNYRAEFGVEGTPLARFEIIGDNVDPLNGTFRFSRPGTDGRNYMLEDMIRAVAPIGKIEQNVHDKYKAPFFDLYIEREAKEATRAANRILTGRGQTKAEFIEALDFLAKVPDMSRRGFRTIEGERLTLVGGLGPAHELKAKDLTDRMNEAAKNGYDLFAFPDDDIMNIRRAAEALAAAPRPIQVWLIWTREGAPSRLVDLDKLETPSKAGLTLDDLLRQSLDSKSSDSEHSKLWQEERAALMCRALFF